MSLKEGRKPMKLQRLGGYAAIASVFGVAAYVVLVIMGIVRFTLWQIMFLALNERVQNKTPQLASMSLITASAGTALLVTIGILFFTIIRITLEHQIPVQDFTAYRAIDTIVGGLIITTAHFFGWAFLLMGCAILRARAFSSILSWLFAVTGLFGMLAFIYLPLASVFLLMICVVSVWIGIVMLRQNQLQPALEEMAVSAKQRGL
jgi:hypothetical protein